MKISNNILAFFVLMFLISSIFLNLLIYKEFNDQESISFFSGYATNVVNAQINLSVDRSISIVLFNNTINFGTCEINSTKGYSLLDSNQSNLSLDNYLCINGTFPDYLVLANIGNVNANVDVKVGTAPRTFFNDTNSWLAFAVKNNSISSYCEQNPQSSYLNFSDSNIEYQACSKLTKNNAFNLSIKAYISSQASGGGDLAITFVGSEAT
ncbi:MAG: hypothetical protein AB7V77_02435 [Candidatus Woesearchaeota archaeon]